MGNYSFANVPQAQIPRSNFTRSHGYKTTFNAAQLIPFYVDEALPGDTFNAKVSLFARLATPIYPVMDNLYLDTFFFAIPLRLVWDNFQRFMGEQPNPGDTTDFLVPQLDSGATTGFDELSLFDYFGIPTKVPNLKINALALRAYNLVWNEWFRDQNLQDSLVVNKGDSGDLITDYVIQKRAKRHDYFTGALPWPQKGPGVPIPVAGMAEVVPLDAMQLTNFQRNDGTPQGVGGPLSVGQGSPNVGYTAGADINASLGWIAPTGLQADLSTATAATINQLRLSFQIQRLYERDARGGTRYTEILRSHFGVVSPDARLQRPEYLGGSSTPIIINPVAQTAPTGAYADTPQGNLAGYGLVGGDIQGFTKSFVEHSIIIGLCNVRADINYQQGLNRMWSRQSRFDFYWPALAHLGEQEIRNREIYAQGSAILDNTVTPPEIVDDQVFGYQERWAEYKYYPGMVTGLFRSNCATPLDSWHLALDFAALPKLNAAFIEDQPPIERVIAVTTEPHLILDSYFQILCARPMPLYSVPGYIDHF